MSARRGGESSKKAFRLRRVWLCAAGGFERGVGDQTTSAVGAHE
jgi:hypothetical protein